MPTLSPSVQLRVRIDRDGQGWGLNPGSPVQAFALHCSSCSAPACSATDATPPSLQVVAHGGRWEPQSSAAMPVGRRTCTGGEGRRWPSPAAPMAPVSHPSRRSSRTELTASEPPHTQAATGRRNGTAAGSRKAHDRMHGASENRDHVSSPTFDLISRDTWRARGPQISSHVRRARAFSFGDGHERVNRIEISANLDVPGSCQRDGQLLSTVGCVRLWFHACAW